MPRQGLGHSSVDIYNMVTPGTDDPVWRHPGAGQLMVGYQQTRSNFVLFSQDATDTEAWTKQNTAISTTLYEAPDNSTTANAIKSNTTGSKNYYLQQQSLSVTAGKTYTASVHLKKGALGFGWLRAGDGTTNYSAAFNLNTGAVTNTSQVLSTSVDAMDDDWFRCSVTFQAQNTSSNGNVIVFAQIDATDNTPNVAASDVELLYVWGWQLEENSEMSAYIVTTNSARTTTETLNDTSETWDFDSADLMPEADPDDDGVWEIPANIVLNGDYEELGSEIVANGGFDTDTWWLTSGANVNISNGKGNFTAGTTEYFYKPSILTVGKRYKVVFEITDYTSGYISLFGGSFGTPALNVGTYERYFTCADTSFGLVGNGFVGSIDNVSVKQVDPNDRWTLGTGWSIEDGKLVGTSVSTQFAQQSLTLTSGTSYEVTFSITGADTLLNNNSFRYPYDGGVGNITYLPKDSPDGTYTNVFTSTGSSILYLGYIDAGTFTGTIDNVTVREYAIQPQDV